MHTEAAKLVISNNYFLVHQHRPSLPPQNELFVVLNYSPKYITVTNVIADWTM